MEGDGDRQTVNATRTSFSLLEALAERQGGAGVTTLAGELDLPKSTAYKHLKTLREAGYVSREGDDYVLGIPLGALGEAAKVRNRLYTLSKPYVDELTEATDELAGLVVERGQFAHTVYVTTPEAGTGNGTNSRHLHCSAPGKAILALLPDDDVDEIVAEQGLPRKTVNTVTSPDRLRDELDSIAERGIAFGREEQRLGHRSVAVPIVRDGEVLGSIYVAGSTDRLTSKRFEEDIPGILLSTVKRLPEL